MVAAPRSVRGLPGPFAAAAIPARTSRRVSVMAPDGYSSRSRPVFVMWAEDRGRPLRPSSRAWARQPCLGSTAVAGPSSAPGCARWPGCAPVPGPVAAVQVPAGDWQSWLRRRDGPRGDWQSTFGRDSWLTMALAGTVSPNSPSRTDLSATDRPGSAPLNAQLSGRRVASPSGCRGPRRRCRDRVSVRCAPWPRRGRPVAARCCLPGRRPGDAPFRPKGRRGT